VAEHDSVIPAGGSGTLTASVKTTQWQSRRISKAITVLTDSADQRSLTLRFTVEAYSPIVVRPGVRINLTTIQGAAGSTRILLHRADGKALTVTEVVAEHPQFHVRASPVTGGEDTPSKPADAAGLWEDLATRRRPIDAAPGDVWIEFAMQEALVPGSTAGELHLTTNHPEAPELNLPYMVRVRPLIEARPEAVRMWLSPNRTSEGRSAIVSLRHNRRGEFAVTDIEVSHPDIFVAAANSTGEGTRQAVRVALVDGLGAEGLAGSVEGWIKVATDDPERPMVEIPVIVSPTRALTRRRLVTRPAPTR